MADVATQRAPTMPANSSNAPNGKDSAKGLKKQTKQPPKADTIVSNGNDEMESEADQSEEAQSEAEDVEATNGTNGNHTNGHGIEPEPELEELEPEAEVEPEAKDEQETNVEDEEGTIAAGSVDNAGNVVDEEGKIIATVSGGDVPQGSMVDEELDILDDEGNIIGKANPIEDISETAGEPELQGPFGVQDNGEITNASGVPIGQLAEGDPKDLVGQSIKEIDEEGVLKNESGSTIGKADLKTELFDKADDAATAPEETENIPVTTDKEIDDAVPTKEGAEDELPEELPDLSILEGKKVNKLGNVVDEKGTPFGQLVEGVAKKLVGRKVDAEGKIWDDSGKVVGRAELLPESERDGEVEAGPFEDFPDATIDAKGDVLFEGRIIGKISEGDAKKLEGKKVDADGEILDKHGNVLGKAERVQEEEPAAVEEPEAVDLSLLEGKKVNKAGNVVDENGKLFGRVIDGDVTKLVGLVCDAEGKLWSNGKVVGNAELVEATERDLSTDAPFESFPDAVVDVKGDIVFEGEVVGKLIEGDAKKLAGKKVDKDGEIIDKAGNVVGKAERWFEEDAPEPETVDLSTLAGKRVNKAGNVVDANGSIFGRLVEGDPKKLAGRMCDKNGNVLSEGGDIIGRAELVSDSEREGEKTGPFADFQNPTVIKEGKIADANGSVIGRIIQGDAKVLFGKPVDADGDILDRNGNSLGKAERWEEEVKEVSKHPAAGRKVNREGNVVDENGDIIAKLTEGEATKCAGKSIDDDGDVVDGKGKSIGHVTLLEDIPEPPPVEEEPKESEEEIEERKKLEEDKKLAAQLATCVSQSIDKIKPVLKMITETIDATERQPKEERDEQKLVDTVKPLIEQGSQILQEANGAIRGLDPDGRISANAKHKTAAREASPEEAHLAEVLKELTEGVTSTIDQAKKKISGMPHAKKELNPLWSLLSEPLGQILAAVGLLLSGVLGLVGKLLSGLGLGGLLDNLLGGLGVKGILKGLGLGMVTDSLTGKK